MTHADTLRGMAKAFLMVGSHEQADTCLAGADAIDALALLAAADHAEEASHDQDD